MSNRDGKAAKRRKGKKKSWSKPGQLCPECRENKLKAMYPGSTAPKPWMKVYAFCENPRCRFSNF